MSSIPANLEEEIKKQAEDQEPEPLEAPNEPDTEPEEPQTPEPDADPDEEERSRVDAFLKKHGYAALPASELQQLLGKNASSAEPEPSDDLDYLWETNPREAANTISAKAVAEVREANRLVNRAVRECHQAVPELTDDEIETIRGALEEKSAADLKAILESQTHIATAKAYGYDKKSTPMKKNTPPPKAPAPARPERTTTAKPEEKKTDSAAKLEGAFQRMGIDISLSGENK